MNVKSSKRREIIKHDFSLFRMVLQIVKERLNWVDFKHQQGCHYVDFAFQKIARQFLLILEPKIISHIFCY